MRNAEAAAPAVMSVRADIRLPDGQPAKWLSLVELLRDRVAANSSALAVEVDGRSLLWSDLDRLSEQTALNLSALGVVAGDRVASMLYNCAEQVILLFAAQKIGAVYTPFNVALGREDLAHVVRDAEPKLLVCDGETRATVDGLPDDLKSGLFLASVGDARAEALFGPAEGILPAVDVDPSAPALIIYTGGTTGLPKGVVLPNFALVAAGYRYVMAFKVTGDDRHYSVLPLFHVGGLFIGLLGPMVAGIPTHFERWFSNSRFWPRVKETGATIIDPIGTMVSVLCSVPETPEDTDNGVRASLGVLSASAPPGRLGVPAPFRPRSGERLLFDGKRRHSDR